MDLNDLTTTYGPLVLKVLPLCLAIYLGRKAYDSVNRRTGLNLLKGPENDSFALGHLGTIRDNEPGALYKQWFRQYGHVMRFFGPLKSPLLLTTDLRAIAHIIHHSDVYQKPPSVRLALSQLLGWGVLLTEGDQHRLQRKALNPAFGPSQMRDLTGIFLDKANELRNQWSAMLALAPEDGKGGCHVEALGWYSKATLDIIGSAGFGYEFDALSTASGDSDELYSAFRSLFGSAETSSLFFRLIFFFPILRRLPIKFNQRANNARLVMERLGTQLVEQRKIAAALEAAQGEKLAHTRARDILGLLVRANASANPKERMTDAEVLAQIPTFLAAGHETTSTLLAWITYCLSTNTEVQTRLREECIANPLPTGARSNSPMTSEELTAFDKLPLLDAVIRETLRRYAPISESSRQAMEDDVIPTSLPYIDAQGVEQHSIRITKGDGMIVPTLLIHQLEELWGPNVMEWNPDRWLTEDGVSSAIKSIPGLWGNILSFLGGTHACIGWKFSLYETKILLHALITAFTIELAVPAEDIGGKHGVVTRPFVKSQPKTGPQMPLIIRRVVEV